MYFLRNTGQKKMIVMDSRPKTNAQANRLGGGGFENKPNYKHVKIIFQDIENIHVVRNSLNTVRAVYTNDDASREKTSAAEQQWLKHIVLVLKSAKDVVQHLTVKANSVLVHCSDGWDRTAQVQRRQKKKLRFIF